MAVPTISPSPKQQKQKSIKKPTRRVRFQELDKKEKKRLKEVRAHLKNQGYRPIPKKAHEHLFQKRLRRYSVRYLESLSKDLQSTLRLTLAYLIQPALLGFASGFGLVLSAGFIFGLGLILNAGIIFACISSTLFSCVKILQRFHIQKVKEIDSQHSDWIKDNQTAYNLGYASKEWLPYLKSYFKMEAYLNNTAYQVGLEHAQDGRPERFPRPDACDPDRLRRKGLA